MAAGSGGSVVSRVGATVRAAGSGRARAYLRTSDPPGPMPLTIRSAPVVVLLVQLTLVRPRLRRRSAAILDGAAAGPSTAHNGYIALEVLKAGALLAAGVQLLIAPAG